MESKVCAESTISVKFVLKQKELRIKRWAVQPAELSRPFGVPKLKLVESVLAVGSVFSSKQK